MNSKIILVLAAFLMLFVVGCVSVKTYHKQNADGSAVVTENMDMSGYINAIASMMRTENISNISNGNYTTDDVMKGLKANFSKICDNVSPDVTCTANADNWTVILSKTYSTNNAFYTFETHSGGLLTKEYTLTIDKLPSFGNIGGESTALGSGTENESVKLSDSKNVATANYMKKSGMTWTYTIEMPGKITSAENGKISKDNPSVVMFDILKQMSDSKKIVVESEEKPFCIPGFILLFIGLGALSTKIITNTNK